MVVLSFIVRRYAAIIRSRLDHIHRLAAERQLAG
jgi:hypothetical protein